jgi:hypothetical protein
MRTPLERVLGEWKNVIVSSVAITHLTGSVGSTLAETSFFALSPVQSPNKHNARPRSGVAHHAARLTPSTSVRDDKASARCTRPTCLGGGVNPFSAMIRTQLLKQLASG